MLPIADWHWPWRPPTGRSQCPQVCIKGPRCSSLPHLSHDIFPGLQLPQSHLPSHTINRPTFLPSTRMNFLFSASRIWTVSCGPSEFMPRPSTFPFASIPCKYSLSIHCFMLFVVVLATRGEAWKTRLDSESCRRGCYPAASAAGAVAGIMPDAASGGTPVPIPC